MYEIIRFALCCEASKKYRRGNAKFEIDRKIKNGECIFGRNNNIHVNKWKDKREVLIISIRCASLKEVKSERITVVKKVSTIGNYNYNVLGIDRSNDGLLLTMKSLWWYKNMFLL